MLPHTVARRQPASIIGSVAPGVACTKSQSDPDQLLSDTRVEETARIVDRVEDELRTVIPAAEVDGVVDNIGLPVSGINLSYSSSAPTSSADADIYVTLNQNHAPTEGYVHRLRPLLSEAFLGVTFSFLPADIFGRLSPREASACTAVHSEQKS